MNEKQILAIRCAYADLVGALQARNHMRIEDHDWKAHALSIQDLLDQFPDILEEEE